MSYHPTLLGNETINVLVRREQEARQVGGLDFLHPASKSHHQHWLKRCDARTCRDWRTIPLATQFGASSVPNFLTAETFGARAFARVIRLSGIAHSKSTI
ncbi:hypothetical protein AcW1_005834 [Taiwanofungus camphoratus]|nr:hypothetical protein AcW1_005834 [Antrodia cinnamomea]